MSIKAYDSGVYTAPVKSISKNVWFMRDPEGGDDEEVGPLLHICEKNIDPDVHEPTYVLITGVVKWDFAKGHYWCLGCKKTWDRDNELGLRAIWSDGFGSGDEGQA
jgi:hypothetical protein